MWIKQLFCYAFCPPHKKKKTLLIFFIFMTCFLYAFRFKTVPGKELQWRIDRLLGQSVLCTASFKCKPAQPPPHSPHTMERKWWLELIIVSMLLNWSSFSNIFLHRSSYQVYLAKKWRDLRHFKDSKRVFHSCRWNKKHKKLLKFSGYWMQFWIQFCWFWNELFACLITQEKSNWIQIHDLKSRMGRTSGSSVKKPSITDFTLKYRSFSF